MARPMLTTRFVAAAVAVVASSWIVVAEPSPFEDRIDDVVRSCRREMERWNRPSVACEVREKEKERIRTGAVKVVRTLIEKYGAADAKLPADVTPGYLALLRPPLAPSFEATQALVLEFLNRDPESPACWAYLETLVDWFEADHGDSEPPWKSFRDWGTAADAEVRAEASLALSLFEAKIAARQGEKKRARKIAETLVKGGEGSPTLLLAARKLRSRLSLLDEGRAAPAFRLKATRAPSPHVTLDGYRGRILMLHFSAAGDDADASMLFVMRDCRRRLPMSDLALLTVPLGEESESAGASAQTAWPIAAPGSAARDAALGYGVDLVSALFLVSPDGKILKRDGWDDIEAAAQVEQIVRREMGPPLEEALRDVQASGDWGAFRSFWHRLAGHRRTYFHPRTWAVARGIGPRAHYALCLASAEDERKQDPGPVDARGPHGALVSAWLAAARDGDKVAWDEALAPLEKPRSDECLKVVDLLFDLGMNDPALLERLARIALKGKRWETASMALRTLQHQNAAVSPKPFRSLIKHKRWQIPLALAEALIAYRHIDSVDLLVQLVGSKRFRVRKRAAQSLSDLTGQSLGLSQKRWAAWRRGEGANLRVLPRLAAPRAPKAGHRYAQPRPYYGLEIASDRLVFVLDKSESMYYGLFDGVVEEVEAHLSAAGPTTRFNVVEFDEEPRLWQKKLAGANAANVRKAVSYLRRTKPIGPTNVMDSLRMAFRVPGLDAVVLLSDGLPNRGDPAHPGGILGAMRGENRYLRIMIHTVLLLRGRVFKHDDPRGKDVPPIGQREKNRRERRRARAHEDQLGAFLKELADQNEGTFGVGFADMWKPPPGARTRPSTDK